MAVDPSVRIDIAAEFTGKKAFKTAEKSTSKLEGAVGSLAKKMAIAFSATAVLNFGKAAVKAFAEDEKSAAILANTMKNLGLQFQNPAVESFIAKLSAATGEVDDNLRPAMQKLLQVTDSVSKSQELLTLALDVSAGSGVALNTVVSDLAAAQAGNTKGLKKYALGLTAAELKTIKFEDVTDKLGKTFAGSAAKGAETFSGQMKILTTAAGEAQETIGEGLVNAFKILAGTKTGIGAITEEMADLSAEISDTIGGLALFIKKIKEVPIAGKGFTLLLENFIENFAVFAVLSDVQGYLSDLGEEIRLLNASASRMFTGGSGGPSRDFVKEREAKAAAAAIKAAKLAAEKRKQIDKLAAANKLKLDKAAAVFDLQKIQIAAALKGKISEEEKTRLLLMQAIEEGNADKAEALAKKLEDIMAKNAKIAADLLAIGEVKDPFSTWAGSLALAIIELNKLNKSIADISGLVPGVNFNPTQNADRNYDLKVAAVTAAVKEAAEEKAVAEVAAILGSGGQNADRNYDERVAAALAAAATNTASSAGITFNPSQNADRNFDTANGAVITINIAGNVLDGDDFTEKVNDALLNANKQGLSRTPAGFLVE